MKFRAMLQSKCKTRKEKFEEAEHLKNLKSMTRHFQDLGKFFNLEKKE